MQNIEIARALGEIGDLLDIQGGDPFRVRAYRNAVRTISNLTRPLAEMVAHGEDLEQLPGIGHDIAGHIAELVGSGRLRRLADLEKKVPPGLVELLRIPALGPKRARLLHDALGIRSLSDLRQAVAAGKVGELKGFGPKTVARIRAGIEAAHGAAERYRLADAEQFVRPLIAHMHQLPGVERVDAAGSYRRRAETVGDIDLLVTSGTPSSVIQGFVAYPDVARVGAAGRTRSTVILRSGLQVDLRVVAPECHGAALHYFTGSKAHNIEVRAHGVRRGLRISEYGVFRGAPAKGARPIRVGGAEETDVFDAVGMDWVPPELRENRGEVEAALTHRLPTLVENTDIRGDLQMHSKWSDGHDSIEAMAFAALARGYEYICITDHSHSMTVAGGLDLAELRAQWVEITAVRRKLHGRLHLFRGMEVDILRDGSLDLADEDLARLDLVVASVHSHLGLSRTAMTDRVIRAMAHPAVDILGHPTGRIINRRPPVEIDMEAVLRSAAALGVAVELNAQPDRLDLNDIWVRRASELDVTVAINTDAHSVESLDFMRYGVYQARRGWLECTDILNTRPLNELSSWLKRRGPARSRRERGARPPLMTPVVADIRAGSSLS